MKRKTTGVGSGTIGDLQVSPGAGDEVLASGTEGKVGQRWRELLREIARSLERMIYAKSINRESAERIRGTMRI
jgi:hypothetical protein